MTLRTLAASAIVGLALMGVAAVAIAQDVVPDPAIATMTPDQKVALRQAHMKEDGGILRSAGGLSGDAAVAAATTLLQNFTDFGPLFSEDTKDVAGSEALPAIWAQWDTFNGILTTGIAAATAMKSAAEAGDAAAYGDALKALGGTCGQCHQQFRS